VEVPVQQASRLPPVDESSSGVSTETDNDVVLVDRVTRVDKVRQLTGDENAQRFVDAKVALATAPWYNRPLYAAEELKTDFDGTVKMGTLRALIEYLTGDFISRSLLCILDRVLTISKMLSRRGHSVTSSSSPFGLLPLPTKSSICSPLDTRCCLQTASAAPRRTTGGFGSCYRFRTES
jgi:hypothetical protein